MPSSWFHCARNASTARACVSRTNASNSARACLPGIESGAQPPAWCCTRRAASASNAWPGYSSAMGSPSSSRRGGMPGVVMSSTVARDVGAKKALPDLSDRASSSAPTLALPLPGGRLGALGQALSDPVVAQQIPVLRRQQVLQLGCRNVLQGVDQGLTASALVFGLLLDAVVLVPHGRAVEQGLQLGRAVADRAGVRVRRNALRCRPTCRGGL